LLDKIKMNLIADILDFIFFLLPIILPIGLFALFINILLETNRKKFISSQESILLEILPPQEIEKSPAAMELFLTSLYNTSDAGNWYEKYFQGKVRTWFSLEIISIDGHVNFYIWSWKKFKKSIESQLYAQFPGIEIAEVDDYSLGTEYDGSIEIFGAEMELTQPDPYPIKTYIDYGLDKETEEEYKVDPITPVLESLGSISKGHQFWIQIIVRAHKKEDKDPTKWFGKTDLWKDVAKSEIKKIRENSLLEIKEKEGTRKIPQITKGQELRIVALERSISKMSFDTGLRLIYLAEKDQFDGTNIASILGSFKQYNSPELNGFKPAFTTSFDAPWEDLTGKQAIKMKEEILESYKKRDYFWKPYRKFYWWRPSKLVNRKKFVLNTEELATIYHFPGKVAYTPTVKRVRSKKATAPFNLPV
jgi:hypothetical protein